MIHYVNPPVDGEKFWEQKQLIEQKMIGLDANSNAGSPSQAKNKKLKSKKKSKSPSIKTNQTVDALSMLQARADADNDGKISEKELQEYFSEVDLNEALVSQYRKLLLVQAVASVLIIIVLATVTGLAIQLSKESHVTDGTFVGKEGNAIQCASKELEVGADGVLTMKKQDNQGIQDEIEPPKTVIRTLKAPSVSHPLNSKVPDK